VINSNTDILRINGEKHMQKTKTNRNQTSLEEALLECRNAAQRGYTIAKSHLKKTSAAVKRVSRSLNECLKNYEDGSVRTPGFVNQIKHQLNSVSNELEQLQMETEENLEKRKERLDFFSVTLFGRTMAGKSTLMEILTNGDGESIGKGSQRTTRDVRNYEWKGFEVTDVPGVAAFEGEEDEELAFQAAEQADLVLFLVTDDAPQDAEAECLARIRRLGKPILGICNVKAAVDNEDDLLLFLRKPERAFDEKRLNDLLNQFHEFTEQHVPGKRIPFVKTHLRSRYIADLDHYEKYRDRLINASRFGDVESRIIKEITGRGTFLRIKSFVDGSAVPMLEFTDSLLEFSAQNSSSGRVLIDKRRQLQKWQENFKADSLERINTLVSKLMDDLRADVPDFAEEHYEDQNAGEKWNKHVNSAGNTEKIKALQRNIQNECKKAMSEVARELQKELSYVAELAGDRNIKMEGIFDTKRWLNWGVTGISGGLGIAALIIGSGPLGWVAAGVGVVGWLISLFLDDREKKARKGRQKLSEKLYENINNMEKKLREQLTNWFHKEIVFNQVHVLLNDLGVVTSSIFELADAQRTLAWAINNGQKELTKTMVTEALSKINALGMEYHIRDFARIPGSATMFLIGPDTHFPEPIKKELEHLLGERIWFVIDTGNAKSTLTQAIGRGCDRNKISIEEKLKVAHVPIRELDAMTLTRVKLAQQLTSLHVMQ
jgi:hypothetical protein